MPSASIRLDRTAYAVVETGPLRVPGVTIVATYTNHSSEAVYLATCDKRAPRWRLEKRTPAGWVPAYEPACTLVAPDVPPRLLPGDVRTDTLVATHHAAGVPRFAGEIPGTYRLVYHVFSEAGDPAGSQIPLPARASAGFEIRE